MDVFGHHLYEETVITSGSSNTLKVELWVSCSCGHFSMIQPAWSLDAPTRSAFIAHVRESQLDFMEA